MHPQKLLIVTAKKGLVVCDTPRPVSEGGIEIRKVSVGAQVYAYDIHYFDSVPYARLVPANPQRPEWARIAEVDGETEYVDVIELETNDNVGALADSITLLANSITLLATNFREWGRKKST